MCVEEIQSATVFSVGIDKVPGQEPPTKEAAIKACQALEDSPMKVIPDLFHEIYKSHRSPVDGGAREVGLNPLRQVVTDQNTSLNVDEISRRLVLSLGSQILQSC
jgi:hypothetical protein